MDQELTYKWIQDRLRELNSGTLSEKDRVRLVEIAKEDPFVADALEGFHAHPDGPHEQHLERLKEKIIVAKRTRRRWLIPNLTVTAIAASVLVIIATFAVITRIEKQSEEAVFVFVEPDSILLNDTVSSGIAMETDARMSADDETKIEAPQPAMDRTVNKQTASEKEYKKSIPVAPSVSSGAAAKTEVTASQPVATDDEPVSNTIATSPTEDEEKAVMDNMAMGSEVQRSKIQRDEGYYANQMDPDMMNRRVTGRVVDALHGDPIGFAKLSVSYTNQLFYTDIDGNFELFIPESEAVVQVTFTGYSDSLQIIKQGEENIHVGLKPGVILPSSAQAAAKSKGPVLPTKLIATESFLHLNRHILSSSTLRLSTEASSARRKVTVEFNVKEDGRPVDIIVTASSRDKSYDGEAVRLIETGPEWVCPAGVYPCRREYTFLFR